MCSILYIAFFQNVIPVQAVKPIKPQYASNTENTDKKASNESTESVEVGNYMYVCTNHIEQTYILYCTVTIID